MRNCPRKTLQILATALCLAASGVVAAQGAGGDSEAGARRELGEPDQ
jgi:hypothetical protein